MQHARSPFLTPAAALVVSLLAAPGAAHAQQTAEGHEYAMHVARPAAEDLDKGPSAFDDTTDSYVLQGPEHTFMWGRESDVGNPERATFALGERRMGLFVPKVDLSRSASEASGWSSYGHPVTYKAFDVTVERGDDDRTVDGRPASHYVLHADLVSAEDRSSADSHETLSTDLWVVEDAPFSWAPFATAGMFGDPRLKVAMHEQLAPLGMVVRLQSRYRRQAQNAAGEPLGHPHESTWLMWVSGLEPAQVPVVNMPVASEATLRALRDASRQDPAGTCSALEAGETPAFVAELLDEAQQEAFMPALSEQCDRLRARNQG